MTRTATCYRCDRPVDIRGMCNSHYQAKRTKWIRAGIWERPATAVGVTRRVQALVALGWPQVELCRRTGITRGAMSHIARGNVARTSRVRAQLIADLYEQLSMTPGPSQHARDQAAARGWVPPLAWDEDAIDDPSARPDRGPGLKGGFLECYEELVDLGVGQIECARRMGITFRSLQRQLHRHGITVSPQLQDLAHEQRKAG